MTKSHIVTCIIFILFKPGAAAAALTPAMQKGNGAARMGHIALNSINVSLFAWQVVTGFDIAIKVWGFTHW